MGLATTIRVLTQTNNEAAVPILLAALDGPHATVRDKAWATLGRRRFPKGPAEVLKRLARADDATIRVLRDNVDGLLPLLRQTLAQEDATARETGARSIVALRAYDLIPFLAATAEGPPSPGAELAAGALVELTHYLNEEIETAPPRSTGSWHNPATTRRTVLPAVEAVAGRYPQHRRREILEALLLLASPQNESLRKILLDAKHPAHETMLDLLTHSPRPGIIRLLLGMLSEATITAAVLGVVASRCDREFLERLAVLVGREPAPTLAAHFKHVRSWPWLTHDLDALTGLSDEAQEVLIELANKSGVHRQEMFAAIERLLRTDAVGARRAASRALASFDGAVAAELNQSLLNDSDPQVKANAVAQLRSRGVSGALATLVAMIDSPEPEVSMAAREQLQEFDFARYLKAFDQLDDDARRATGQLVRKIDLSTMSKLMAELRSDQRMRRLRALAAAQAMEVISEIEPQVTVHLLYDPDHVVRAAAAKVLAGAKSSVARRALRQALSDTSILVQESAEASLELAMV